MNGKFLIQVSCMYKAHLPTLIYIPGQLVLNEHTIIFKSYYTNHNPLNLDIDVKKIIRYQVRKGLLGHKLFIYYNQTWYKFSHFKSKDIQTLVHHINEIQAL
ncbi:hypothetical protein [Staphylococcus warneri]|uniref:hypothetical protein n=1 Tax=Staphylococcus warneri TaxID=1292 RepID=UPI001FB2DE50|nr:hypothetical protein [Staphylococcus warneri]MCJ1787909.1 hypothetical protein [Staphylococcus warneri]MCJ1790447.1 hypothetical protein [Staphylococcus warneri]MCJ1792843.1 hypothetical protein [Staphylococcus warneri]MCJ1795341.1 hypothetical protein [Staphylococcus warneri]MCJ1797678.1 hypothetical protein [Staphylococcus warneri]